MHSPLWSRRWTECGHCDARSRSKSFPVFAYCDAQVNAPACAVGMGFLARQRSARANSPRFAGITRMRFAAVAKAHLFLRIPGTIPHACRATLGPPFRHGLRQTLH